MHSAAARLLTIVHVVFSSRIAGAERHALDLAAAQADMGHEVHVVGPWSSSLRDAVAPTVRYHAMALPILRSARLNSLLRRLGADVCHGHLGPACKAVSRCDAAPRFGTLHVGYKRHQHQRLDALICVNEAQTRAISDFKGDSRLIFNWAPQTRLPQGPTSLSSAPRSANPDTSEHAKGAARASQRREVNAAELRTQLGTSPGTPIVITVARLHPSKGVDVLIRAFVQRPAMDAVLLVLGEGKSERQLKRLAARDPRIHLLGFRPDVDALLHASDVFVSPSREEAMPLAVLEAMRASLPIVATATQGATELLARLPTALVPVGDADALGAAIEAAVDGVRRAGDEATPTPGDGAVDGPMRTRRPVVYDLTRFERGAAVLQVEQFYRSVLGKATAVRAAVHV